MSTEPTRYPRVWLFDPIRRVYPKSEKGRFWSGGGPIYREHWREVRVNGETRVSWITEWDRRIPKKGGIGIAFSLQEVEDDVWREENRHNIARMIEGLRDVATLRKVSELIGYKEKEK